MTIEKAERLLSNLVNASEVRDGHYAPTLTRDGDEITLGNDEVVLSFDATNELGQPWGVAPLNYNPGGFDHRTGDGEPPSVEAGPWTSYPTAQEACRAAVLLLVTLRMDEWLAGMAEEGAER